MKQVIPFMIGCVWVLIFFCTPCLAEAAKDQHALIGVAPQDSAKTEFSRTQHPDAQWFGQAGLGLFIHWGLPSAHPDGLSDLSWSMMKDCPWNPENSGVITPRDYFQLAERFQPDRYDPQTWLSAAAKAGFRYAVLTTKHHDGYALWPSQVGQFNTRTYMQSRDLVRPYVDACRKYGLKVGLYYSPPDWYLSRDYMSFHYGSDNQKTFPGRKAFGLDHQEIELPKPPPGFEALCKAYVRAQIIELLTQYGPIDLIWFDGGPNVISIDEIRQLQPQIVINPRMHRKGDFVTPECRFPEKRPDGWWELCYTWGEGWGYRKSEQYRSAGWALDLFVRTRAWGGNLLLNVGPRPNGEFPDVVYDRFREIESWMIHSGESVFGAEPGPWPERCSVPVTIRQNTWYLHLGEDFSGPVELKHPQKPLRVTLLRTGQEIPFTFQNEILRLEVPKESRTPLVDVVKVQYGL